MPWGLLRKRGCWGAKVAREVSTVASAIYSCSVTELMTRRRSCRVFDGRLLQPEVRRELLAYALRPLPAPFGSAVRLCMVEAIPDQPRSERLGTYGVIRGACAFLAGAVRRGPMDLEDFGFVFEGAMLKATDLGLGTCWLGGTFARSSFATALRLDENEMLPAVSPVGYPRARSTLIDATFRAVARSDTRKPWQELFFAASFSRPLSRDQAGAYALPLEMLRLAPSASNRQPWRILRDEEQRAFHFFLVRTRGYRVPGRVDLQRVDMGIAMCHFTLTAEEVGLHGAWCRLASPRRAPRDGHYIASWIEES